MQTADKINHFDDLYLSNSGGFPAFVSSAQRVPRSGMVGVDEVFRDL